MNHSIFRSIFLLYLLSAGMVSARTGTASGRVLGPKGQPMAYTTVLLLSATDSAVAEAGLTNEKGEYSLTPPAVGSYLVQVVMAGYTTVYTAAIDLQVAGVATVPDVELQPLAATLGEVAITAQKPLIEVKPDKIVVNVENSITSAGSSVLDVLARSPGVAVDQNDLLSLKGKRGVNVQINGKTQPMSGEELANVLKSMPASMVASIELIANPSAKYDAAGTAGIINIKLKRDGKKGLNGSANATYAQGVYGKANAGFNLQYRNKQWSLYTGYTRSQRVGFNKLDLDRAFYKDGVFSGAYIQTNNYLYHINSDQANIGVDYRLTAKTIIGASANGDATYFRRDGSNYSNIIDSATRQPLSHFTTSNSSPNQWNNIALNLNLRHTFDSGGATLAVDADYATYPSEGRQDYTTNYYYYIPGGGSRPSALAPASVKVDLNGLTQIRSIKADYARPLATGGRLEAGIKASYVTADNDLRFYNLINATFLADSTRTNHFIYQEHIQAAYVNYSHDWAKWSAQLGLRVEQTIATGTETTTDSSFRRHYAQPFPSLAMQRHIDKNNDLGITLSRRIERPSYEQLNPFKYYLDPTTYKAGYPYLNPALSYAIELSHVFRQRFVTSFSYSNTSAPITEVIQPSTTEAKVTIQTTKNLTSMDYYGVSGSYQLQLAKWWNNTTNFNAYYARYTGDIAGTSLNKGRATFDVNINNSFLLARNWSAELGGFYQAPQVYGYMNLKPTWMLNVGIQKQLLDKRAMVRLNVTDIFWRGYPRATSYYNDYEESFIAKRDTRQGSMSFTYRFGNKTLPSSQRHHGGAEDEKRRVGGKGA